MFSPQALQSRPVIALDDDEAHVPQHIIHQPQQHRPAAAPQEKNSSRQQRQRPVDALGHAGLLHQYRRVAAQILSDHVRHQAAHIRQMILPLPDTQLQVDAPTLFPRGGTHGPFRRRTICGQGLPQRWAATPSAARYSAQRQKPCISPSAPFLRSPPSCGVSNCCYFNRHSDENQADQPIVSCIFTE